MNLENKSVGADGMESSRYQTHVAEAGRLGIPPLSLAEFNQVEATLPVIQRESEVQLLKTAQPAIEKLPNGES